MSFCQALIDSGNNDLRYEAMANHQRIDEEILEMIKKPVITNCDWALKPSTRQPGRVLDAKPKLIACTNCYALPNGWE